MDHEAAFETATAEFKEALRKFTGRKNAAKLAAAHEAFTAATLAYHIANDAVIAEALAACTHDWAIDNRCMDCGADTTPAKVSEGEQLAFAI